MISPTNFKTEKCEFNQQVTKKETTLRLLNSSNNSVAFQARNEKDVFCRSVNKEDEQNAVSLLKTVKGINLSPTGIDETIKGFFKIIETKMPKTPKHIKINGEKVKLPDLDNPEKCWKWWEKNIGEVPLSVRPEDRERAKPLTKLPSLIRKKLIASLSRQGKILTEYDNPELIKYRADLNGRRILLDLREAKATKNGKAVIKAVSNEIYDSYANSPEGIKKEKKLIVMIGQKASGKTTLVDKARKEYGVVVGDSDDIREKFIGSQETELHGRLKFAVKQNLEDRAIKEGTNYLAQFHGTGTKSTLELIKKFKKAGYDIEIMNLEVPEAQLVERIAKRKEFSGKNADPLSVILCDEKTQRKHFKEIEKEGKVRPTKAKRFDNSNGVPCVEITEKLETDKKIPVLA
jgi:predicted kinase